jgi:excisionase family DNA binding protein
MNILTAVVRLVLIISWLVIRVSQPGTRSHPVTALVMPDQLPPRPEPPSVEPLTYSVEEAARALGVGRTTIYLMLREGQLRRCKIRGRTKIEREEIARLVRGDAR